MSKSDQLKALLTSHIEGDDSHFFAVAMQIAASEAKCGHGKLAQEIRALIDEAKVKKLDPLRSNRYRSLPLAGNFLPCFRFPIQN